MTFKWSKYLSVQYFCQKTKADWLSRLATRVTIPDTHGRYSGPIMQKKETLMLTIYSILEFLYWCIFVCHFDSLSSKCMYSFAFVSKDVKKSMFFVYIVYLYLYCIYSCWRIMTNCDSSFSICLYFQFLNTCEFIFCRSLKNIYTHYYFYA